MFAAQGTRHRMATSLITAEERAEWEAAFRDMVRSTVAAHLLGRLQPVLEPMFETLERIDQKFAEIAQPNRRPQ
jgi:hypothetical protein